MTTTAVDHAGLAPRHEKKLALVACKNTDPRPRCRIAVLPDGRRAVVRRSTRSRKSNQFDAID